MTLGKRKKREAEDSDGQESFAKLSSEPQNDTQEGLQPVLSTNQDSTSSGRRVIIVLDLAALETVKTKKGDFQLLNCDDHLPLIRKFQKDPQDHRPDIIHQELMAVLDSPLNKCGLVSLFVRSDKNVLMEVNSKTRIPRTFKRFSGLMVQLLNKLKIRSADGNDMLLKVIKNPISRHLPAGAHCFGTNFIHLLHLFLCNSFCVRRH